MYEEKWGAGRAQVEVDFFHGPVVVTEGCKSTKRFNLHIIQQVVFNFKTFARIIVAMGEKRRQETSHRNVVHFYSKLDIVVLESFVLTTRSSQLSVEKIDIYKITMGDSSSKPFLYYFLFFSSSPLWCTDGKNKNNPLRDACDFLVYGLRKGNFSWALYFRTTFRPNAFCMLPL